MQWRRQVVNLALQSHIVRPSAIASVSCFIKTPRLVKMVHTDDVRADALASKKPKQECWSKRQSKILTGGGQAEILYTAARGFPFYEIELPHFHLMGRTTTRAFASWRSAGYKCTPAIVGAWKRTWFEGGGDRTTEEDETCFNLQTPSVRARERSLPTFVMIRPHHTRVAGIHRHSVTNQSTLTPRLHMSERPLDRRVAAFRSPARVLWLHATSCTKHALRLEG